MQPHDARILLLLAVGVFVAPPISARLGIPAAIGEMLYGALITLFVPSFRHVPAFVGFLRQFGFLLVLFLAGLELDSRALIANGPGRLIRALPFGVAVPVGSMLGAVLLGYSPVLGLIVGTISIGLTTRVLSDMGLLRRRIGQIAVATGGIGEVVTIISITVLTEATHGMDTLRLAITVGKLFLLFGVGLVVLTLLRDLAWWRPSWFAQILKGSDSSELGMRSSLALMSVFAAGATLLHVPDVLAAFIAGQTIGILFPLRRGADESSASNSLRAKLRSTGYSFFVPIAFITVGQHLDLHILVQPGPLALGLGMTAASGLVRLACMPLLRLQTNWKDAALIAVLLSESLTMKVTVAELAVASHALPAATLTPAIAATTAGDIIFPIIFRWLIKRRAGEPELVAAPELARARVRARYT